MIKLDLTHCACTMLFNVDITHRHVIHNKYKILHKNC